MTLTLLPRSAPQRRRDESHTPSSRRRWRTAQNRAGLAFAVPFFVGFALVFVLPILYALYQSFFKVRADGGLGLGASTIVFAGLDNYLQAFADDAFWASIVRVGVFALVQIPISLGVSLVAALLLDAVTAERRGSTFRFLLLVPYMVPAIVATLIWVYLYSPASGRSLRSATPSAWTSTCSPHRCCGCRSAT